MLSFGIYLGGISVVIKTTDVQCLLIFDCYYG